MKVPDEHIKVNQKEKDVICSALFIYADSKEDMADRFRKSECRTSATGDYEKATEARLILARLLGISDDEVAAFKISRAESLKKHGQVEYVCQQQ